MSKAEALYNLGVLNGPDLGVLRKIITDPSTVSGALSSREAYLAQTDQVRKLLTSRLNAFRQQYGANPQPSAAQPPAPQFQGSAPADLPPTPGPQFRGSAPADRPQIREGQTATHPQTGQRIIYRGGQWVPIQ
jgi:hypothetical protein